MDNKILEQLGFTPGEIKVYTSLLQLGKSSSGKIVDKSGVSKSKVYEILERLANKGVISQVIEEKVKIFQALHPRELLNYYNRREEEFKKNKEKLSEVLPEYEHLYHSDNEQEVVVYKGYEGLKNIHDLMLRDLEEGDTLYISVTNKTPKEFNYFYEFDRIMVRKKLKLKIIFHDSTPLENLKMVKESGKGFFEVKILGKGFKTPTTVNLWKNKTAMVIWSENPAAVLIEDKLTHESFQKYFDVLWDMAKEVK